MEASLFSDISRIKNICEQNHLDRRESIKILSSVMALSQLHLVHSQMDDETQQALEEKSAQTYDFLSRQIHRVSMTLPAQDQQSLNQIQIRLKDFSFR